MLPHARCVWVFAFLIFVCLPDLSSTAIAQGTSLSAWDGVAVNIGAATSRLLLHQDSAKAQTLFGGSSRQTVDVLYSDRSTMFMNVGSDGGEGQRGGGVNWHRKYFTQDPKYAVSKVIVEFGRSPARIHSIHR